MKSIKAALSIVSLLSLIACADGVYCESVDISTIEPISKPVLVIETLTVNPEPVTAENNTIIAIPLPDTIDLKKVCSVKPSAGLCNNL